MGPSRSPDPGFSRADRRRLVQALGQAHDAKLYRRLRAVAEVADGEPIATVEGARCGRPRAAAALTDDKLRQLLTSDPGRFGYAATTWTVPLLAAHLRAQGLALSARTLRRRIHAARFRWKRPRYVYSTRAAHVGAKKGGSSAG